MFKYCPNCNSKQIIKTDLARYDCPTCDYVFYHNTASAVAAIIRCEEAILFNVRSKEPARGMLDLPGGFVDYYERLEHALTREVEEELGITLADWNYLSSYPNQYLYNGIVYHTCDAIFDTTLSDKPTITLQQTEVCDYCWIPIKEIDITKIGFKSMQNAVLEYINCKIFDAL
ncbi:NUDIX hydrolase [Alteromonas oceanisediminis]|uniref:NUDIX hydrolase n=1 Tax=Alteromonas oceanisediminis TaxID=2836180 RepID=UPI001BDB50AE|nr:NUDIX domain-containing protein [Alteromonas oceanisediminis]MBT0586812.1 NUDIX domain-containing protein [Alteromonas oceanisediminis]